MIDPTDHGHSEPTKPAGGPFAPVVDGRDGRGRFAPGNRLARGNPHARRVADLRSALLAAVGPADLAAIVAALVERAKAGDVAAAREVLDRCLGRPRPADAGEPDAQAAPVLRCPPLRLIADAGALRAVGFCAVVTGCGG